MADHQEGGRTWQPIADCARARVLADYSKAAYRQSVLDAWTQILAVA